MRIVGENATQMICIVNYVGQTMFFDSRRYNERFAQICIIQTLNIQYNRSYKWKKENKNNTKQNKLTNIHMQCNTKKQKTKIIINDYLFEMEFLRDLTKLLVLSLILRNNLDI